MVHFWVERSLGKSHMVEGSGNGYLRTDES
jgi:hypothetical protein